MSKTEKLQHHLTSEALWRIMSVCAEPKVAKVIRHADRIFGHAKRKGRK
jgi:hypothetical protein